MHDELLLKGFHFRAEEGRCTVSLRTMRISKWSMPTSFHRTNGIRLSDYEIAMPSMHDFRPVGLPGPVIGESPSCPTWTPHQEDAPSSQLPKVRGRIDQYIPPLASSTDQQRHSLGSVLHVCTHQVNYTSSESVQSTLCTRIREVFSTHKLNRVVLIADRIKAAALDAAYAVLRQVYTLAHSDTRL